MLIPTASSCASIEEEQPSLPSIEGFVFDAVESFYQYLVPMGPSTIHYRWDPYQFDLCQAMQYELHAQFIKVEVSRRDYILVETKTRYYN